MNQQTKQEQMQLEKDNATIIGIKVNKKNISVDEIDSLSQVSIDDVEIIDLLAVAAVDIKGTLSALAYNFEKINQGFEEFPVLLQGNNMAKVSEVLKNFAEDFDLLCYFEQVVESSVVGVRKPDPAIFALGVEALNLSPEQVAVVGDSYTKDILPAYLMDCSYLVAHPEGRPLGGVPVPHRVAQGHRMGARGARRDTAQRRHR
mgnify:CR=1 FL=1